MYILIMYLMGFSYVLVMVILFMRIFPALKKNARAKDWVYYFFFVSFSKSQVFQIAR